MRYSNLISYMKNNNLQECELTYAQVGDICGGEVPMSAKKDPYRYFYGVSRKGAFRKEGYIVSPLKNEEKVRVKTIDGTASNPMAKKQENKKKKGDEKKAKSDRKKVKSVSIAPKENWNTKVLINHIFTGGFIASGNLGHEFINICQDDKGRHYVYVMSKGDYATGNIGKFEYVLLVRNINQNLSEVIAKCKVREGEQIFHSMCKAFVKEFGERYSVMPKSQELANIVLNRQTRKTDYERRKFCHDWQCEYMNSAEINYAGKTLPNIFKNNDWNELSLYITFEVIEYRRPKAKLYLYSGTLSESDKCDEEGEYIQLSGLKRASGAAMHASADLDANMKAMLGDKNLWEESDTTGKADALVKEAKAKRNKHYFLNIIRKKNDEIIYSNLIAFYLSTYPAFAKAFIKEVLANKSKKTGLRPNNKGAYLIERETENNIDIWMQDEKSIIVIENKIRSGINGQKKTSKKNDDEESVFSQLKKYYEFAEEKKGNKETHYFLLLPDYSYRNADARLSKYEHYDKYGVIRYSDIKNVLERHRSKFIKELPYYEDFLHAVSIHASPRSDTFYEDTLERLVEALKA